MPRKVVKPCLECGQLLVVRRNRESGDDFLGCSQYPRCDHTQPLPEDVRMRLQGAATLPGFK